MTKLPPPLAPLASPVPESAFAASTSNGIADPPALCVVTPSFNQGRYLEAAIRSVLSQGYPKLQYFVVDGGSSDDSVAIIRHYEQHLSGWLSEKDRGQADAIQKGLARCTGDWFVWINSDDLMAPGALWTVARACQQVDAVAGVTQYFNDASLLGQRPSRNLSCRSFILEQLGSGMKWHQPAFWFRREPLARIGFNTGSHYAFDHELVIRYLRKYPRVRHVDEVLAWFRYHPASKTVSQPAAFRDEQVQLFRALGDEPEFAELAPDLDRAARAVAWLSQVDALLDARERPRLERLRELIDGVRGDRSARCTRNTRRAARRILQYGGRR